MKYSQKAFDENSEWLQRIANELAEANRLERIKMNKGYYEFQPLNPLEDEA